MDHLPAIDAESSRLLDDEQRKANWKRWGPYLSERQWGTVREDYSVDGSAWAYFPHDHARSRAYRWGEDGLLGITDRECRLCFALALWNGRDPILKERLFGLTGPEGNHGEDVKEEYFYLDSTPTHSYMKALYKYPQAEFPYLRLVEENRRRTRADRELDLLDTGIFDQSRYFDVQAEYAKASPNDILIRITVANRGPDRAKLHLLPTIWFRNTWSWGCLHEGCWIKPRIDRMDDRTLELDHVSLGRYRLEIGAGPNGAQPPVLFTDNHTNTQRLFGSPNPTRFVKDAFHEYLINGSADAVNPKFTGTKAAPHYVLELAAGQQTTIRLRLSELSDAPGDPLGEQFDATVARRIAEADIFYSRRMGNGLAPIEKRTVCQAYAGLLWSKQFYHYIVNDWVQGDPNMPPPPAQRQSGRNCDWHHVYNRDVLSMPDKWEYPWFAAWDLAFHAIPLANVDPEFAKQQLLLLLREWYMHPNGQIPAYEWALGDVNPPVHAWACFRIYKMTGPRGHRDRLFLARAFQKLMINFTWWVNRKDISGRHLFSGGFLGLDNIGVFDRSGVLPGGGRLEQADGTAWMAFFCGTMLSIALELASEDPAYEDVASKFFEHFVAITDAMNSLGGSGLWDEEDGFYYDWIHLAGTGQATPLRVRSLVGLIPLTAVEVLEDELIDCLPGFRRRMDWFLANRKDLARHISYLECAGVPNHGGGHKHYLLAIPSRQRLERMLKRVLDESEFLSPFGVRSLSQAHFDQPYTLNIDGECYCVGYEPGESKTSLFGGNSNWRGPIWFPVNYLLIEALERYHHFYRDSLKVECPTGSGTMMNLKQVAAELARRLSHLFLPDASGRIPWQGSRSRVADDPHWKDLVLFHEYFHGDSGEGLGASHQTGWTALVARCIEHFAAGRDPVPQSIRTPTVSSTLA